MSQEKTNELGHLRTMRGVVSLKERGNENQGVSDEKGKTHDMCDSEAILYRKF